MSLYLDSGYINFDHVEKIANSNRINFVVIIGKRQVGKTYGTLDLMLRRGYYFMLLRRTADEMKFITVDVNNPFEKLPYNVKIESESKYTAQVLQYDTLAGTEERIGSVTALSTIAKIRGFDGSRYTQLVYDEAIPETHVIKLRNEGDAFLNAYTTISGNRELEGAPPLRAWILANSNDIHAPILHALDINEVVERMSYSGQELAVLDKRGIMVILPASEHVTELRSKTALYRAIGTDSEFS
ncbi:MAG: phage DNA encapsidation protein, partial [Exiguobacterium sp.]|nr:phage DNA encapsidation protein [Exiguobacterium sp.]